MVQVRGPLSQSTHTIKRSEMQLIHKISRMRLDRDTVDIKNHLFGGWADIAVKNKAIKFVRPT